MTELNYKEARNIDKDNLDEECLTLPLFYDEFNEKEVLAWEVKDHLQEQIPIIEAQVNLEIRGWEIDHINEFFRLELTKVTEDVYKQLTRIHPTVVAAYEALAVARAEALTYSTARKAIEKKHAALEMLAKLHGQGYFSKIEGKEFKKAQVNAALSNVREMIKKRVADLMPDGKPEVEVKEPKPKKTKTPKQSQGGGRVRA